MFLTDFRLDLRVLAFAGATALGTSVLFGILPALNAIRSGDVIAALRRREQRAGGDAIGRRWLSTLVVAELAVATTLLVGAGLVIRSFARLQHVRPGFAADHVLTMEIPLAATRYPTQRDRDALVERALDRIRAIPGVRAAGVSTNLPLDPVSTDAIFSDPLHPYTRALVEAAPRLTTRRKTIKPALTGDIPNAIERPAGCHFHPRCPMAMPVCRQKVPVLAGTDRHRVACFAAETPR